MLGKSKYKTWRLWDDKDLQTGDQLTFINSKTLKSFAKAKIVDCYVKKTKDISKKDIEGHEDVGDFENMQKMCAEYYKRPVNDDTKIKIVEFTLLEIL